jgi:DNA-binding transcriptional regulator YhcF (GntR family)
VGRFVTGDLDLLEEARQTLRREFVRRVLQEAGELGITRGALMDALMKMEESQ